MSDSTRARKIADRIRVIIAQTLEKRVKDPRLGFITITDVRVTGDLQHASVFYTVYGDETQAASTAAALKSARGLLRSEVGKGLQIRLTPSLEFISDHVPEEAANFDESLAKAKERDRQIAALAAQAQPAGEENPYRAPRTREV